jgi:hypothetical protein
MPYGGQDRDVGTRRIVGTPPREHTHGIMFTARAETALHTGQGDSVGPMTYPSVTDITPRPEPVTPDPFIDRSRAAARPSSASAASLERRSTSRGALAPRWGARRVLRPSSMASSRSPRGAQPGLLGRDRECLTLVCLVDDVQWLDPASSQILGFCPRRSTLAA